MSMINHLLIILLAFSAWSWSGDKDPAVPHISFEKEFFNFGTVRGDSIITHVFVFTNTGNDTLHIKRVKPG